MSAVYRLLQTDLMSESAKQQAASIASFIQNPEDAGTFVGRDGFTFEMTHERFGVLKYHGIEVLGLFKRQTATLTPNEADPVPEKLMREPVDAWVRIDLLNVEETALQVWGARNTIRLMNENNQLKKDLENEKRERSRAERGSNKKERK